MYCWILCGPATTIPQNILCEAFLNYISGTERALFKDALSSFTDEFTPDIQEKLLST